MVEVKGVREGGVQPVGERQHAGVGVEGKEGVVCALWRQSYRRG
jgi:hypothetical protein